MPYLLTCLPNQAPPMRCCQQTACRMAQTSSQGRAAADVYPGMFGEWSIDDNDIAEVRGYRAGITAAAASAALTYAAMALNLAEKLPGSVTDAVCVVGVLGLGASLYLIHIYVTEIKRAIQVLFLLGVAGGAYLSVTQDEAVAVAVVNQPLFTLLVGPLFAAVTGVAIKEGLCYGKAEAAILAVVTPLWLLGHLTRAAPDSVEMALAGVFVGTFVVFAARKYTQAIKDDIGDKSVFEFRKLPEDQQERILKALEMQRYMIDAEKQESLDNQRLL